MKIQIVKTKEIVEPTEIHFIDGEPVKVVYKRPGTNITEVYLKDTFIIQ